MSDVVIRVEKLGKLYHIGAQERYKAFRDSLTEAFTKPFKRLHGLFSGNGASPPDGADSTFWALKDVSFEVKRGEVIGIIGRNGAGKSTLLKLLSRITEPTEGFAEIRGRVGSLLEVGTGFHPELTGRENIYLNGAILGMHRSEIRRKFDEIVAFAEVERFIDTPVKHYSSGMYLRLAFAVAAHLDPEILVIDEVLAVGDAAFQKKCLGKMGCVAQEGRTVLFVSHNMQAISTLTQRSLLLSNGRCLGDGPSDLVIAEYSREGNMAGLIYEDEPSNSEPKITRVELRTSLPGNIQFDREPMEVIFEITTPEPLAGARLTFQALNSLGEPVLMIRTADEERPMLRAAGKIRLICRIHQVHLFMGHYSLKVFFTGPIGGERFQVIENLCPFEVAMNTQCPGFKWESGTCAYLEDGEWDMQELPFHAEFMGETARSIRSAK
jgi:lipopolysaccharide transport system ATP-binding protein